MAPYVTSETAARRRLESRQAELESQMEQSEAEAAQAMQDLHDELRAAHMDTAKMRQEAFSERFGSTPLSTRECFFDC